MVECFIVLIQLTLLSTRPASTMQGALLKIQGGRGAFIEISHREIIRHRDRA